MLEAKVRDSYRFHSVQAVGGLEFIKSEFRPVPPGQEEAIMLYKGMLEIREREPVPKPEPVKVEELDPKVLKKLEAIAKKSAKDVIKAIEKLDDGELAELREIEGGKSRPRKSVLRAIEERADAG